MIYKLTYTLQCLLMEQVKSEAQSTNNSEREQAGVLLELECRVKFK